MNSERTEALFLVCLYDYVRLLLHLGAACESYTVQNTKALFHVCLYDRVRSLLCALGVLNHTHLEVNSTHYNCCSGLKMDIHTELVVLRNPVQYGFAGSVPLCRSLACTSTGKPISNLKD